VLLSLQIGSSLLRLSVKIESSLLWLSVEPWWNRQWLHMDVGMKVLCLSVS